MHKVARHQFIGFVLSIANAVIADGGAKVSLQDVSNWELRNLVIDTMDGGGFNWYEYIEAVFDYIQNANGHWWDYPDSFYEEMTEDEAEEARREDCAREALMNEVVVHIRALTGAPHVE